MSSHTSPYDHMTLFVAKSSPERTWVPRYMTGRLTVRRLVNINPGRPKTSSTATLRKPHTTVSGHQEVNPRASSSSSACLAPSSEPSTKREREEVPPPPPTEVKLPPPEEVKPPPPKVALQPVAVVRAPPLNANEATWSLNLYREAFVKLRKVAIHLGVPAPRDPL
jgi:hypothetical protein